MSDGILLAAQRVRPGPLTVLVSNERDVIQAGATVVAPLGVDRVEIRMFMLPPARRNRGQEVRAKLRRVK